MHEFYRSYGNIWSWENTVVIYWPCRKLFGSSPFSAVWGQLVCGNPVIQDRGKKGVVCWRTFRYYRARKRGNFHPWSSTSTVCQPTTSRLIWWALTPCEIVSSLLCWPHDIEAVGKLACRILWLILRSFKFHPSTPWRADSVAQIEATSLRWT